MPRLLALSLHTLLRPHRHRHSHHYLALEPSASPLLMLLLLPILLLLLFLLLLLLMMMMEMKMRMTVGAFGIQRRPERTRCRPVGPSAVGGPSAASAAISILWRSPF